MRGHPRMRVVCARRLRASCVGACACKHVRVVRVYEYVCVSMCREISGRMHTAFSIIVQFRLRDEFCIRFPGVGTIVHVITPHQFTAWGGLGLVATPTAAPQGGRGGAEHGNLFEGRSPSQRVQGRSSAGCLHLTAGSSLPGPPLRSRSGWGRLAQRLRLEAYPLPARSDH